MKESNDDKDEPYYTTHQVAALVRVSAGTVRKWCDQNVINSHRLPTYGGNKIGKYSRIRIAKKDLIEFIKKYELPMPKELEG